MKIGFYFVLISTLILGILIDAEAQMKQIEATINKLEAESHLRILASDEMRGRNTGTTELNIAARYISEQFRKYGLDPMGDESMDFLQQVPMYISPPPAEAAAVISGIQFHLNIDIAFINGDDGNYEGDVVYLKDIADLDNVDVKNKIVVLVLRDLRASITNLDRVDILKNAGASGLVEIFGPGQQFPWSAVVNYIHSEKMKIGEPANGQTIPHIWVRDTSNTLVRQLSNEDLSAKASITLNGISRYPVKTFNVIGKIQGTDPRLKDQHLVLCAHYDHVGVQGGEGVDSIYNGARDNAIGTTGLLNAAKYFSKFPARRSLVLIALTGEEKGLLGSQYYTNHPAIPLEKTVFTLNIDNSGYTTTDVITLLDTARTNIDELVYKAASEVGLGVIGDRLPEQNYYERSDQVSFASKGVPSVNFKMSMTDFDERITEFYHRPSDEIDSLDLEYIHKYWKAFIRSAELIGNWEELPYWIKGDKFESAGNKLYNK